MITFSDTSLLARWQQQLGKGHRKQAPPRPLAAVGYLTNGPVIDGLVEVQNLVVVVLYDDQSGTRPVLNLAGYTAAATAWGVQWGGPRRNVFFKNLLLRPSRHAHGRRLDSGRTRLLQLALQLNRQLDRHVRHTWRIRRRRLRLLPLWAGFRVPQAATLSGGGPELAAYAQRTGQSPEQLLHDARRPYEGLCLLPLEWVSHHWQHMAAVFADLDGFPSRQVFPLRSADDLQGFRGASQFDFVHNRFASPGGDPPPSPADPDRLPAVV